MSDATELIPIREAARRLGVSDTAVRKAYNTGRIDPPRDEDANPDNGRPRLRWPLCRDQWNANTNATKRSHVGPRGAQKPPPAAELGLEADDEAPGGVVEHQEPQAHGGTLTRRQAPELRPIQYDEHGDPVLPNNASLAEAQRIKAIIAARQGLLDLKRDRGEVVPVAQVERDGFKAGRVVRDAFLNIADRISADLAAETDRARVHALLSREIRGVLQRLPASERA